MGPGVGFNDPRWKTTKQDMGNCKTKQSLEKGENICMVVCTKSSFRKAVSLPEND